jgi:hypothetical protein
MGSQSCGSSFSDFQPSIENNQRYSNVARGGKRDGAGRKVGAATKKTREVADKAAAEGITPLEYMLELLRDTQQPALVRFEAAKAAAPYVHPKLSSVEVAGDPDRPVGVELIRRVIVDPTDDRDT